MAGKMLHLLPVGTFKGSLSQPEKVRQCWKEGHIASKCTVNMLNPAARPFLPAIHAHAPAKAEPTFDELLKGSSPVPRELPQGRPEKVTVYIERDAEFFTEVGKLNNAMMMYCEGQALRLEAREVVSIAVNTNLVRKEEIRVAKLSGQRFLIHLPKGLAVTPLSKQYQVSYGIRGLCSSNGPCWTTLR